MKVRGVLIALFLVACGLVVLGLGLGTTTATVAGDKGFPPCCDGRG